MIASEAPSIGCYSEIKVRRVCLSIKIVKGFVVETA